MSSRSLSSTGGDVTAAATAAATATAAAPKTGRAGGANLLPPPALTRQLTSAFDNDEVLVGDIDIHKGSGDAAASSGSSDAATSADCDSSNNRRVAHMSYELLTGTATDIGGGHTNQDDLAVYRHGAHTVMMVWDGHGRELGQLASEVARTSMTQWFKSSGAFESMRKDPDGSMKALFSEAHLAIKESFRKYYTVQGHEVRDTEEGYLIKRSSDAEGWSCTHGGTTATVVVVLDGWKMIVGNVGDSTALWGSVDESSGEAVAIELSADHSPESEDEFLRIRDFRPFAPSPHLPEMRFVYDAPAYSKHQCPSIFDVDPHNTDKWHKTGKGNYYKNVRNEWATLVTTPPYARFQDALAFTRSLGDLHLHVYGVSSIPEVRQFDLNAIARDHGGGDGDGTEKCRVLLVCTDGVWDNWKFADLVSLSMQKEALDSSVGVGNSQVACDQLMAENLRLARKHFGSQADNMSAVLCYLIPTQTINEADSGCDGVGGGVSA